MDMVNFFLVGMSMALCAHWIPYPLPSLAMGGGLDLGFPRKIILLENKDREVSSTFGCNHSDG
jgi:hypothetical protein